MTITDPFDDFGETIPALAASLWDLTKAAIIAGPIIDLESRVISAPGGQFLAEAATALTEGAITAFGDMLDASPDGALRCLAEFAIESPLDAHYLAAAYLARGSSAWIGLDQAVVAAIVAIRDQWDPTRID